MVDQEFLEVPFYVRGTNRSVKKFVSFPDHVGRISTERLEEIEGIIISNICF